eukprot:TRINITY_DN47264_c0_g2_i1.p1 TRINITY_DN47264_c0_g2~~TRINITY_DN47264_c0_g2_i1.p1  ORF type:complete len:352 (-),score=77.90 TRINITY_DN47264_c0_g2_i1:279-1334(-)
METSSAVPSAPLQCGALAIENPLGVGTNSWGTDPQKFNEQDIRDAFVKSLDAGVTLFDTAQVYSNGDSEQCLGKLRTTVEGGERAIIMSKFHAIGNGVDKLVPSLRETLQRCKLDCLDVFFIHHPKGDPIALADQLAEAHRLGLLKRAGVSNYDAEKLKTFHELLSQRGVPLIFNEIEFSLLRRSPESDGLLRVCQELGVTVVAWAPLAQGRLTAKHNDKLRNPQTLAVLRQVEAIAAARSKTAGQVAINWCVCKGVIPIPGARNARQAEQNAGGAVGWRLTEEEIARLDAVAVEEAGLYSDPEAAFATWGWPNPWLRAPAAGLVKGGFALAKLLVPLQEKPSSTADRCCK